MPGLTPLLLADSRFPAGGYAHSGGLEAACDEGLAADDVAEYLRARLHAVAAAECALAVAATRESSIEALLLLDEEALARVPSPVLRTVSQRLGSQLLRTASVVWPEAAVPRAYRAASTSTPRTVAFGVVAAAAGLDELELARGFLYDDAATVAAAAVKLLPVDVLSTTRLLVELEGDIERLALEAVSIDLPVRELPSAFAPLLELRSLAHGRREGRLFAS
jgi:urease accessory protein